MEIHRSYFYYTEKKDDSEVEAAIRNAAEFGDGFWKIHQRLRHEGYSWNHKKVYRVYKQMHYEKRSKLKKRLPARVKSPLVIPSESNDTWSIDFVSDRLQSGSVAFPFLSPSQIENKKHTPPLIPRSGVCPT